LSEEELRRAMRALGAYVEGNIADLDAEQARLDALLGRSDQTREGAD
jgi:hypothetical protein